MDFGSPEPLLFVFRCAARSREIPDTGWLLTSGTKVLTMQAGFGLLEASMCRKRNVANIMMKNVGDLVLSALLYQLMAYGLIYGEDVGDFGILGDITVHATDYAAWFFHFSFAATAATIDSGTLAERVNFFAYVIVSGWMASIVYPVTAHWVWNSDGWLAKLGFIDFAGSGVVHMLGAVSGLCCMLVTGPRIGRFTQYRTWQYHLSRSFFHERRSSLYYRQPLGEEETRNFDPIVRSTNPVQMLFGTLMLWIGWYGFNGGSTLGMTGDRDMAAAKIFVTTTLGAAGGGFGASLLSMYFQRRQERLIVQVQDLCNGILSGLVGITAGAPFFRPSHATGVGMASGIVGVLSSKIVEHLQLDDVVGAISVHGVPGVLGVLFVGLLAEPDCAFPEEMREDTELSAPLGIVHGGSFSFLATQCLGILAIGIWGFLGTWFILTLLHFIPHQVFELRAERCNEIIGMDLSEHLFDDDICFQKEHERDLIRAFNLRVDVEGVLWGKDSPRKFRAYRLIESEQVRKAVDNKTNLSERMEDLHLKVTRRLTRLERAFDRRTQHLDACVTVLNENIQSLVKAVNESRCSGSAVVQFTPVPEFKACVFNEKKYDFTVHQRDAIRRIETWWHRQLCMLDGSKLSVLKCAASWKPQSQPLFNPDKAFESSAFRPKQVPAARTDVHELITKRRKIFRECQISSRQCFSGPEAQNVHQVPSAKQSTAQECDCSEATII